MKISLRELRKILHEEIEHMFLNLGSQDSDLRPGSDVGVATPSGPVVGKVSSRYSGDGPEAIWTVKTDGGTVQKKAADLKLVDEPTDSMSQEEDDEKDKTRKGFAPDEDDLLIDITEADERYEQREFTNKHYEFMARQIVFNWRDKTPEVSWNAVAANFARGLRSSTGKILDVDKLCDAIQTVLNDGDAYEAQWKQSQEMLGV